KGVFRTILEHPDLKLIHLVRLLAMLKRLQRPAERQSGMDWGFHNALNTFRSAHSPLTLLDLAEALHSLELSDDVIVKESLWSYFRFFDWEAEAVWPFMISKLDYIERAMGAGDGDPMHRFMERYAFENALHVLTKFPRVPPRLVSLLWEKAIGTNQA